MTSERGFPDPLPVAIDGDSVSLKATPEELHGQIRVTETVEVSSIEEDPKIASVIIEPLDHVEDNPRGPLLGNALWLGRRRKSEKGRRGCCGFYFPQKLTRLCCCCLLITCFIITCGVISLIMYIGNLVGILMRHNGHMDGHGVDGALYDKLNLMGQYAGAAYCASNNNSTGTKVTCSKGNCPKVEAADTKTALEISMLGFTDVNGFVAVDSTNRLVVVSFRGSVSKVNFIVDVNYTKISTDLCRNCQVHRGFWQSWKEARTPIFDSLKEIKKSYPDYQLAITGHSLGGAIATLCAADFRRSGMELALYSYGSPRVGDSATAAFISKQAGGNYRVTHLDDIVPKLPPLTFGNDKLRKRDDFGFVHVSPEYYIKTPNYVNSTVHDVNVFYGEVNFRGNTGQLTPSIDAHRWYFNNISTCTD